MIVSACFLALVLTLWAGAYLYSRYLERIYPPAGPLVDIGTGRIHCVETPAKGEERAVVLLVHGASGNYADLHVPLADRLSARGFRVIAVDRPGAGWSDRQGPRAEATAPDNQAKWIREALHKLGVDQAIVVVHSLAGALGLTMARDAPDFTKGLVLMSPATHPWPGGVSWYYTLATSPIAGKLFRWLIVPWAAHASLAAGMGSVFWPAATPPDYARRTRLLLMVRPWHFLANAEDVADFERHVTRLRPSYGEIRVPAALITGDSDRVVYPDIHSFGCLREVSGVTMRFIRNMGHSPHWMHPEAVMAAVEEVLARAGESEQVRLRETA